MVCPECKQRFSPEEVIRATCSRIQNSVWGDSNLTEPTIGHDKELPKAWMDVAALRYPYDFDENGCTIGNKGGANESWLHNKDIRSVLVHLRFDQHAQLHRPTCFKKSEECRANLPMLICNESYLFDNEHVLANSDAFHVVHASEHSPDKQLQAMREVDWHHLNSECPVTEVSQFLVIPKRPQACQFLNQHSIPISEVISCNTNVSIGDPSCVYYNTLYKTKSTQKEDKHACQRACAQIG